jgi:hypothetical protein
MSRDYGGSMPPSPDVGADTGVGGPAPGSPGAGGPAGPYGWAVAPRGAIRSAGRAAANMR